MVHRSTAVGHQTRAQRRSLGEGQGTAEERRGAGRERAQPDGVPDRGPRDEDLLWIIQRWWAQYELRFDLWSGHTEFYPENSACLCKILYRDQLKGGSYVGCVNSPPLARGSGEAEFTQPWAPLVADPCIVRKYISGGGDSLH